MSTIFNKKRNYLATKTRRPEEKMDINWVKAIINNNSL